MRGGLLGTDGVALARLSGFGRVSGMHKLWLRLLGIGEEEEADLSRRGFLKMLGGAAVVTAVAPTYVFAPTGGWGSKVFDGGLAMRSPFMYMESTAQGLNDFIVPQLADNVFKPSPVFTKLMKGRGAQRLEWNG